PVIVLLLSLFACQKLPLQNSQAAPRRQKNPVHVKPATYSAPVVIARIKSPDITESSGLVASQSPGIYWTHNDSGDGPFIYAIDIRGQSRGVWRVAGALARDWEDIAAGPGPQAGRRYLYIGDIGDNERKFSEIVVYRVREPSI